jgi:hypothetical protein
MCITYNVLVHGGCPDNPCGTHSSPLAGFASLSRTAQLPARCSGIPRFDHSTLSTVNERSGLSATAISYPPIISCKSTQLLNEQNRHGT